MSKQLYDKLYCAHTAVIMPCCIKENQLDMFGDRTWLSTLAGRISSELWTQASAGYTLIELIRRIALKGTELANAYVGTMRRLKLFNRPRVRES